MREREERVNVKRERVKKERGQDRKSQTGELGRLRERERIELETRKGKEESVRSEEERECVRSREKIAKEIYRKRRHDGEREIVYRV